MTARDQTAPLPGLQINQVVVRSCSDRVVIRREVFLRSLQKTEADKLIIGTMLARLWSVMKMIHPPHEAARPPLVRLSVFLLTCLRLCLRTRPGLQVILQRGVEK